MQLLGGAGAEPHDSSRPARGPSARRHPSPSARRRRRRGAPAAEVAELRERVAALEADLAQLRTQLADLLS